ncbi:hypothetical protein TIFTF001_050221 [Ficus carica]|uniref:DUF8040 domain-containing protein n=1 Tax=Ficus carica TaxID=3494 RepID=A0AA87YTH4_FICCA|nr:hypothetical protein TIFTF001_050221 [Ficus carica]
MNESGSASKHEEDDQSLEIDQRDNDGLLAMAVIAVTASRRNKRKAPQPMHYLRLTGSQRVEEILNGHEEIIQDLIKMKSDTFKALSDVLGSRKLLRPTCYMNVHEQLFIFYSICAQGATNRHISYLFQHSRDTTSRWFFKVLTAICALKDEFIRPPDYTEVQPIITEHSYKYSPRFDVELPDGADDAGPSIGSQQDASTQGAMNQRREVLANEMWDIY